MARPDTGHDRSTLDESPLSDVEAEFLDAFGPVLADPSEARDRCVAASEEFARRCVAAGVPAQVIDGLEFGEVPEFPGLRVVLNGHFATLVTMPADEGASLVYDWTARQFDPFAPVPLVQTLSEWRGRWSPTVESDPGATG